MGMESMPDTIRRNAAIVMSIVNAASATAARELFTFIGPPTNTRMEWMRGSVRSIVAIVMIWRTVVLDVMRGHGNGSAT